MRPPRGFVTAAVMTRPLAPLALAAISLASACAGPPVPSPIEGLPLCADFNAGHMSMEGSLRYPVRLRVLDGKAQVSKIIITGLRRPDASRPRTFVADDNAEYTLEWAQCENERAPRAVSDVERERSSKSHKGADRDGDAAYDCGEAKVYKTDKLVTKKGDKASHTVTFAAPPNPACWAGEAPLAADAGAPSPADAGADAAAPPAAEDAGAVAADAGATDAGPLATDAGAPASGAGPADAGAKK